MAKVIREAALQTIGEESKLYCFQDDDAAVEVEVFEESEASNNEDQDNLRVPDMHNYIRPGSSLSTPGRQLTSRAVKSRNVKEDGAFVYLLQKSKLESEEKKEKLQFKRQQHEDSISIQREELAYKIRKLEFEEKKWKEESDQRKLEAKRNDKLTSLLETVLKANLSEK